MSSLDHTAGRLGNGRTVSLPSGETLFILDSCEHNPVVTPQQLGLTWREGGDLKIGGVFNAGAEVHDGKVVLMPRCHQGYRESTFFDKRLGIERRCLEDYVSEIWPLVSEDGVCFARQGDSSIRGDGTDHKDFTYGVEDIRIIKSRDGYLLVGCGKIKAPFKETDADRIAIYSTRDFSEITYLGIVEPFDSRNAVPFSEPIGGKHFMLLRFYPNIHLDVLEAGADQLLNPAKHREAWQRAYERRDETLLFKIGAHPHEKEKLGPGAQVIKTDRGWLIIYHAVGEVAEEVTRIYGLTEKIERAYTVGAALLDLDNPRKVLCKTRNPVYIPSAPWELYGDEKYPVDVPAVVFPVGAFHRGGKLMIYAGAADKYIVLLSCDLKKLINYLWEHCRYSL